MNHLLLLLLKSIEVQCTDSDVARSQRACFGPWRKSLLGTSFLDEAEEGFFSQTIQTHTHTPHESWPFIRQYYTSSSSPSPSFIDCTRKDAVAARLYWLPLQAGLVAFHAPPAKSRHGMIGTGSI